MQRTQVYAGMVQEAIRAHIDACGSRMCSVAFIKKNGAIRHMRINGKALLDSLANSERGNRAAETRRQNHPNLKAVPEITNQGAQWRSINLDTVLVVRSGGKVTRYRDIHRIAPGIFELVPLGTLQIGVVE